MDGHEDSQLVGSDEDLVRLLRVGPRHLGQTPGVDVRAGNGVWAGTDGRDLRIQ